MEQNKVILVVDDNSTNRKLIGVFLKGLPVDISEVADALQALSYLARHEVDLVLLDISMPAMSGIELCKIIRADGRWDCLPIIAYTAHAMSHERQEYLDKGFNNLLIKPITRSQLTSVIKQYI